MDGFLSFLIAPLAGDLKSAGFGCENIMSLSLILYYFSAWISKKNHPGDNYLLKVSITTSNTFYKRIVIQVIVKNKIYSDCESSVLLSLRKKTLNEYFIVMPTVLKQNPCPGSHLEILMLHIHVGCLHTDQWKNSKSLLWWPKYPFVSLFSSLSERC